MSGWAAPLRGRCGGCSQLASRCQCRCLLAFSLDCVGSKQFNPSHQWQFTVGMVAAVGKLKLVLRISSGDDQMP